MKPKRVKPQDEAESEPALSRAEYFSERQLLIEARQRSYQRAEQMIVGGATGALLLSITFLEKLVPSPVVIQPNLLVEAYRVRRRPDSLNQATLAWA